MARVSSEKTRPVAQAAHRLRHRLTQLKAVDPDRQAPSARLGPRPLGLHLTGAMMLWPGLPIMLRSWRNGSPNSKKKWPGLGQETTLKLTRLCERLGPGPNSDFDQALAKTAIARMRTFLNGVKSYRHHGAHRNLRSAPVIWQAGTTKLRDYNPDALSAPAVLVIPSLINRFDILDLDFDHSFLRALAEHGFRPLVVDWDIAGDDEKNFGLADYVEKRLVPIADFLAAQAPSLLLLGYCMGGNLALALASLRPAQIRTLLLLATPWDFHRPDDAIGAQFTALAAQMEPYLQALGYLPVDIVQSLFASFQPAQVMSKFTDFAALDPNSIEARHFVLLEDWLNDGVPLTAKVARDCLDGWYGRNLPGRLEWRVGDTTIDPRVLAMPAYVVVPGKDRIVPPESARPLARLLPRASLHEPMTGHVGIIASEKAPQQIWGPMISWLEKHA
jgi:polyhydroxyalkanoate synthase